MKNLEAVKNKLLLFRKERDWKKFHKPKDLAISLVLEANEVLEHFQWKTDEEIEKYVKEHKDEVSEELADVFNWAILMAHDLKIDIIKSSFKKIDKNSKKYPVDKTKGSYKKYSELNKL